MKRYSEPRQIRVWLRPDGESGWVRWLGRRETTRVCNVWLIEEPWWAPGSQPPTPQLLTHDSRTYYSLLTASGALLTVFKVADNWFLEQVAD